MHTTPIESWKLTQLVRSSKSKGTLGFYFSKATTSNEKQEWRSNQAPAIKSPAPVKRPVGRPRLVSTDSTCPTDHADSTDVHITSTVATPVCVPDTQECGANLVSSKRLKLSTNDQSEIYIQQEESTVLLKKFPGQMRGKYKSYSMAEKMEILELSKMCGVRAIGAKYNVTASTISTWKKSLREPGSPGSPGSKHKKGARQAGGGRKVSYGQERDMEILSWILDQCDQQLPVSRKGIQTYAKSMLKDTFPDFKASEGWLQKFMRRNNLSLRCKTSLSQKLPKDLEHRLEIFYKHLRETREQMDYDDKYIINMDEVPMYFDLIPGKTVSRIGQKDVKIITTGGEKKHFTLVLAVTAAGTFLPSAVIFKGT
jgi:hypothetical protein